MTLCSASVLVELSFVFTSLPEKYKIALHLKWQQLRTIITHTHTHTLPSNSYGGETHQIIRYFSSHKSTFVSPWQLQVEMRDNHLSKREGIRRTLLSAYCVGNLLCYDEQCADVSRPVSVSVCGLPLVEQVCCSVAIWLVKKTHQAHFVWLIGFPRWLMRGRQGIRQVWSGFDVIRRFQYLPNDCCRFSPLNREESKAHSCLNLIGSKIKAGAENGTSWKKRSFEERSASDPGLVIVSDFLAEKKEEAAFPSMMFFGGNKRGRLIGFFGIVLSSSLC